MKNVKSVSVLLKVYFHHKSVRQYNIHIKSNNTNDWPPAVGLLPKAQLKGKKEQGAESMKQNTMLLVHHEQKPEQWKDRKSDDNVNKVGAVTRKYPVDDMSGSVFKIRLSSQVW